MTPTSSKSLSPEVVARISRLEILTREVVEGFLSGMHRSPYFGQSIEFVQHREYTPGDDVRRKGGGGGEEGGVARRAS